jgi:hypothetical protein
MLCPRVGVQRDENVNEREEGSLQHIAAGTDPLTANVASDRKPGCLLIVLMIVMGFLLTAARCPPARHSHDPCFS